MNRPLACMHVIFLRYTHIFCDTCMHKLFYSNLRIVEFWVSIDIHYFVVEMKYRNLKKTTHAQNDIIQKRKYVEMKMNERQICWTFVVLS